MSDTGPGVPENVQERRFEPFVTSKPAGLGSGLGLSSSQAIWSHYQETLMLNARVRTGASFVLTLPLAEAIAAQRCPNAAKRLIAVSAVGIGDDAPSSAVGRGR